MPDQPKTQLTYPLDPDSTEIVKKIVLTTKWPQASWSNTGRLVVMKVINDATVLTTGDGKLIFHVPQELDNTLIIGAHACVSTVSSSGAVIVQLRNVTDSVDILSTSGGNSTLQIDANEFDSYTAATQPVINFANAQLSKSDRIAVDVDGAGTGTQGLQVTLSVQS